MSIKTTLTRGSTTVSATQAARTARREAGETSKEGASAATISQSLSGSGTVYKFESSEKTYTEAEMLEKLKQTSTAAVQPIINVTLAAGQQTQAEEIASIKEKLTQTQEYINKQVENLMQGITEAQQQAAAAQAAPQGFWEKLSAFMTGGTEKVADAFSIKDPLVKYILIAGGILLAINLTKKGE